MSSIHDAIIELKKTHQIVMTDSGYSDESYHREIWDCNECNSSFLIECWAADSDGEVLVTVFQQNNLSESYGSYYTCNFPSCKNLMIGHIIK